MKWREMMAELSARTGLASSDCRKVVGGFLEMIAERLIAGDSVILSNFGTFVVYEGKARSARNPRTGAAITVPPRRRLRFRVNLTRRLLPDRLLVPTAVVLLDASPFLLALRQA